MAFDRLKIFKDDNEKDTSTTSIKEHLVDEIELKTTPPRGSNGRFISKKAFFSKADLDGKKKKGEGEKPSVVQKGVSTVSFYGIDIRRAYHDQKWYFSIDDIIHLAKPMTLGSKITKKNNYKKIFDEVTITLSEISYADADGIIKLIRELDAAFPGPLARHLHGSLQTPNPAEKTKSAETELKETAPPANPSDRVG